MDIQDKKVLVTGGSKRIGKEICKTFAEAKARVIIHYNNSGKEAITLLQAIGGSNKGHTAIKADLSVKDDLLKIYEVLSDVDILINNASVFYNSCLLKEDTNRARQQFDINFWAPFDLMCELCRRRQEETVVINMLDYRIKKYSFNDGSYLLSKKSLELLSSLSALQWAPKIRVNGIAPGNVIPPVGMNLSTKIESLKTISVNKSVSVKDICSTCLYLVKTQSITGQIIYLDNGAHL